MGNPRLKRRTMKRIDRAIKAVDRMKAFYSAAIKELKGRKVSSKTFRKIVDGCIRVRAMAF